LEVSSLPARIDENVHSAATPTPSAPKYNVRLNQRRVETVRGFLMKQSVEPPRIHPVGPGPLLDPATPKAKQRGVTAKLVLPE